MISRILAVFALACLVAGPAQAQSLRRDQLIEALIRNNEVSAAQAEEIVSGLERQNGGQLPRVATVLRLRGVDLTIGRHFFNRWTVRSMEVFDPEAGLTEHFDPATFGGLSVQFQNGGLAGALVYQWLTLLFSEPQDLESLDGAIFGDSDGGRGLGYTWTAGIGYQYLRLTGVNRPGHLYVSGFNVGVSGGWRFPRMTFIRQTALAAAGRNP